MEGETLAESGQVAEATPTAMEQGQGTPEQASGQSLAGEQITGNGPGNAASSENTFFDVNDLPEELMPAYKSMQSAFTRKMQSFNENKHKLEAYDSFQQNPVGTLQALAQQYGFQLMQPGQQMQQGGEQQQWEPQTWEEVLAKAEAKAEERVLQRLQPLIGQVQEMKQSNTETFLDNNFPDWRQYEDKMHGLLEKHPSLVNDPGMLYKMAVPDEVLKARAAKSALAKLQANTQNAQISHQGTKQKPAAPMTDHPPSFNEAVEIAKARLAQGRGVSI